ncbi:MAG: type II secretion system protein GspJ [Verrucomicrobiia bacterium]|jgi:type II secretory pathway component PulJ
MNLLSNQNLEPGRSDRRTESAFTLLELIVASLMFSIIMASISTAFYGAYQLRETNENDLRGKHQIRRAIQILKRDLRSAALPTTNDTSAIEIDSEEDTNVVTLAGMMMTDAASSVGSSPSLSFYSASAVIRTNLPWHEIQFVNYSLRTPVSESEAGGMDVVRSTTRNLLSDGVDDYEEQVLLSGVQNLFFEFYDGTTWQDAWDSTTQDPRAPKAIRATFELVPESDQRDGRLITMVVPISVEALTNTVVAPTAQN